MVSYSDYIKAQILLLWQLKNHGLCILTYGIFGKKHCTLQGRPQDLAGGGARIFFFRFGNLHVAKRHAAHGEAIRFARGVWGHAPPPRKFFKMVNLMRFGVYFDQILSLKNFNNYHFLYKNFKNCNFFL